METPVVKTHLERLLFERGLSEAAAAVRVHMDKKTFNNKVHRRTAFNLPEMKSIQKNLFPEYTLEEIFEGY